MFEQVEVPGIKAQNVARFFRANVPNGNGILRFELISGGRSNLTYTVKNHAYTWVLRRPPLGHVLPTAHDMAREFRILRALADTRVPVPRPIALCEDPAVNDMPFYVMEYKSGIVLSDPRLPVGYGETPEARYRISMSLIDVMVRLHTLDYRELGLEDFGRPDGYLERQVRRWAQQWERSKTSELREIDELGKRLQAAIPPKQPPTIVHGDYRLGNMAYDQYDIGRICAVFDWEMATLGDPLADLGYTLIYWADPDDQIDKSSIGSVSAFTQLPGFMRRADLVAEYGRRTGRDVSAIDFYQVLALYKLAIISEGIYARYLQGKTVGSGFANMVRPAGQLARRALDIAEISEDRHLRG